MNTIIGNVVLSALKLVICGIIIKVSYDIFKDAIGKMTLYESHEIAQVIHDAIEDELPNVKHCMVHVNPFEVEAK